MASAMYRAFKEYKIYMEGVDKSIKITQSIDAKVEDSEKNEKNVEAHKTNEELKKEDKPKVNPIVEKSESSHAESSNENTKTENNDALGVVFKVQIASSTTKIVLKPENFNGLNNVEEEKVETVFKYTVGNTRVFNEALSLQGEIREKSYKDAFIVALYNGKRITLQEAFEIQKKQSN
jgi:N-acetylmuramoyl-L-alanine amidase